MKKLNTDILLENKQLLNELSSVALKTDDFLIFNEKADKLLVKKGYFADKTMLSEIFKLIKLAQIEIYSNFDDDDENKGLKKLKYHEIKKLSSLSALRQDILNAALDSIEFYHLSKSDDEEFDDYALELAFNFFKKILKKILISNDYYITSNTYQKLFDDAIYQLSEVF